MVFSKRMETDVYKETCFKRNGKDEESRQQKNETNVNVGEDLI